MPSAVKAHLLESVGISLDSLAPEEIAAIEAQATALEVHSSRKKFFAGQDPGVEYRAGPGDPYPVRYDGQNIVGNKPAGSQNYGPMAGANALVHWENKGNRGKVNEILDAWEGYARLDYLTTEWACCNIYIAFISMGVTTAADMAAKVGRKDLAEALWKHTRTGAVLSALSAGWKSNPGPGGFGGHPVTMCGSRSFSGRIMYELSCDTFACSALAYYTGMDPVPATSMEKAQQQYFKIQNIWGATSEVRAVLKRMILNQYTDTDLELCIAMLRDGPGFAADAAIIRTSNMVAWCNLSSVNTGSTSYIPAKAWYAGTAPKSRWGIPLNHGVCTVDYPRRAWGGRVVGEFVDGGYRAQRVTVHSKRRPPKDSVWRYQPNSWFDETKPEGQNNRPGWSSLALTGDLRLDLRVGRSGVQLVYPDGEPPPPPPPPDKVDMLEAMAPKGVPFTKVTTNGTGRIATIRDDASRVFVVVKGANGTAWDWFYWDDTDIYHVITEGGEKGDPTAFKSHAPPGVKWCRRFATLGETLVSGPVIYQWSNCVQGPEHRLGSAITKLHSRSYTAGELGMASNDVPSSTVCYRLDWRWGPDTRNVETFTYAVNWGFLDWYHSEHSTLPNNQRSPKPVVEPVFPCFDVADWIDENMRPVDPPPPGGGWHSIETQRSVLKFNTATAEQALAEINAGKNHLTITQVALYPEELAQVKRELEQILGG